jgi:hypothetical protein
MKFTAITLLLFLSKILYGQEFKFITIDPYLSFQYYEHFKRLTLSSPDSDLDFLEGFDFQWGYTYKLKVKQTKLDQMLSDGTQFRYSLEKIISKTKVNDTTQFKLSLDPNRYYYEVDSTEKQLNQTFSRINDSTFLYLDEVEIEVPSALIEAMNSIVEGQALKVGTFIFVADKRNRIRLIKI